MKILAKVELAKISNDYGSVRPSWWDSSVVQADLEKYLNERKFVKGTPTLRIENGQLKVNDGLPFILAASKVGLKEIICNVDATDSELKILGLPRVNPTELLAHELEPYMAKEMIFFNMPLDHSEKLSVEHAIEAFFAEASTGSLGGAYREFVGLSWSVSNDVATWSWSKNDSEGPHLMKLMNVIKQIAATLPVRSFNGFRQSQ